MIDYALNLFVISYHLLIYFLMLNLKYHVNDNQLKNITKRRFIIINITVFHFGIIGFVLVVIIAGSSRGYTLEIYECNNCGNSKNDCKSTIYENKDKMKAASAMSIIIFSINSNTNSNDNDNQKIAYKKFTQIPRVKNTNAKRNKKIQQTQKMAIDNGKRKQTEKDNMKKKKRKQNV